MKTTTQRLLFIAFLLTTGVVSFIGCSKSTQNNPSNNSTSNTSMNAQEQSLVGDWILKRQEYYYTSNDSEGWYSNFYSPTTCHLNLQNTVVNNGASPQQYNGINGLQACNPISTAWNVPATNNLNLQGAIYTIVFMSTDSLILKFGNSSTYSKYILSKTSYTCGLSVKEQMINKNWGVYSQDILTNGSVASTLTYTNQTQYYINFQNTWGNAGQGWNCIDSKGGAPGQSYWEVVDTKTLRLYGQPYNIDTLTANTFVFSNSSARYHLH